MAERDDLLREIHTEVFSMSSKLGGLEEKAENTETQVIAINSTLSDYGKRLGAVERIVWFGKVLVASVGSIGAVVGAGYVWFTGKFGG